MSIVRQVDKLTSGMLVRRAVLNEIIQVAEDLKAAPMARTLDVEEGKDEITALIDSVKSAQDLAKE